MPNPAAALAAEYGPFEAFAGDKDFHPTVRRPFPSMDCTGIVRSGPNAGKQCQKKALYGASVCIKHGATLPSVREQAAELVLESQLALVGLQPDAIEALEDLVNNAQSEAVRLKAATEILDRSGVRGGTEVSVSHEVTVKAADLLNERLTDLREKRSKIIDHDPAEPRYSGQEPESAVPTAPQLEE